MSVTWKRIAFTDDILINLVEDTLTVLTATAYLAGDELEITDTLDVQGTGRLILQ